MNTVSALLISLFLFSNINCSTNIDVNKISSNEEMDYEEFEEDYSENFEETPSQAWKNKENKCSSEGHRENGGNCS